MIIRIRKIIKFTLLSTLWIVFFIVFSWNYVEKEGAKGIVELENIPDGYTTALMLWTNTRLSNGRWNAFHYYRVEAIIELVKANKIDTVLVSWDNSRVEYNEPEAIQADLIEYWIPEDIIELDYAWFRTLDSVVRSQTAFGKEKIIIVSQRFHIERALTIARHFDIDAVWYVAAPVSIEVAPRVYVREVLARAKMVLDLFVLGTKPKFEV